MTRSRFFLSTVGEYLGNHPLDRYCFIIGAPKCGTSSLFSWLTEHPELAGSVPKETFYLMDKGHPLCKPHGTFEDDGWSGLNAFFAPAPRAKWRIEATTHHFYQRTALGVLTSARPAPMVLFVARRPELRVYSSFCYTRDNLGRIVGEMDFLTYVELVLEGKQSELARFIHHPGSLATLAQDLELSRYATQLRPWIEQLSPSKFHCVLFEELCRNPRMEVGKICDRLGVNPEAYDDSVFLPKNQKQDIRFRRAHRLVRRLGSTLRGSKLKSGLKHVYLRAQAVAARGKAGPTPRDERALELLRKHFQPDNEELAALLNRDSSPWS